MFSVLDRERKIVSERYAIEYVDFMRRLTEMLVQDVQETVSETPQEEERGRQGERPEVLSGDETVLQGVAVRGSRNLASDDSCAGHFEKESCRSVEGGSRGLGLGLGV